MFSDVAVPCHLERWPAEYVLDEYLSSWDLLTPSSFFSMKSSGLADPLLTPASICTSLAPPVAPAPAPSPCPPHLILSGPPQSSGYPSSTAVLVSTLTTCPARHLSESCLPYTSDLNITSSCGPRPVSLTPPAFRTCDRCCPNHVSGSVSASQAELSFLNGGGPLSPLSPL